MSSTDRTALARFSLAWKSGIAIVLLGLIVHYVRRDALHYLFDYTAESFKDFWPRRILLRTHIAAGMFMIFLGPLQLWTGLRRRSMTLHRWCGRLYLVGGTIVATEVLYMGLHPVEGSIVYGFGLFLNGLFWLVATAMAYYAIRIGNVQAHKEWMIRSYLLVYAGLVLVRVIVDIGFLARQIGTEKLNDLSTWVNWVLPMMVAEVVFQIRRMRRSPRVGA